MTEIRNDGWVNLATGVGGAKDKSSGFVFSGSYLDTNVPALESLYEEDHIAARIIDAPVDAVFVDGYTVELADEEQTEAVIDAVDAIGAEEALDQAMRWERLYGGAAIFLGVDDGRRFEEPVNEAGIKRLMYLHVFQRWELWPFRYYDDPRSPKYGQPSHYRVSPQDSGTGRNVGVVVHESRLIKFGGAKTTKRKLVENQYWGQSELIRAYSAIKQYGGALASVLALMSDASQGVYKIKDLTRIIQGGNAAPLQTRMRAMDQIRSAMNAVLLDADGEDYTRVAQPLTELGNLIDRLQLNVASAANMPATEFFGRSAAGLNATGENDLRSWHKRIAQLQRQKAKPALERILRLMFRASDGPTQGTEPDSWSVKFPPVWSPTAKESAEIQKIKMETAALGSDVGTLSAEQIARGLFSGSEWDGQVVLRPEEIDALRGIAIATGMAQLQASGEPMVPADVPDDTVDHAEPTQDAEGELAAAADVRELAAQMTEHNVEKCEHDKPNRCHICGIERTRRLKFGPDGRPVTDPEGRQQWVSTWRPIGELLPPTTGPDGGDTGEGPED